MIGPDDCTVSDDGEQVWRREQNFKSAAMHQSSADFGMTAKRHIGESRLRLGAKVG
jgi:hypothetical protein